MTKLYTALIASLLNEDNVKASAIFKKIINEKSTNLLFENEKRNPVYLSNINFEREEAKSSSRDDLEYSVPIEVAVTGKDYYDYEYVDTYEKLNFKAIIGLRADFSDPRDHAYHVKYIKLENGGNNWTGTDKDRIVDTIYDDLIKKLEDRYGRTEGLFGHAYKIAMGDIY